MLITKKHPILLPFGWISVIAEYIKLSLMGKRSNKNAIKHIASAKKRKNIYSKIELFKI